MDTMERFALFLDPVIPLLEAFEEWRADVGIGTMNARMDHIGYQCGDSAEYDRLRTLAEAESVFTFQSMVAGRRILLARLDQGLHTMLGIANVMEICDQKPDGSKSRGFDHIEICPAGGPEKLESLLRKLDGEFRDPRFSRLPIFRPSGSKSNPTHDAVILRRDREPDGKVRVRPEPLLEKIARDEFR